MESVVPKPDIDSHSINKSAIDCCHLLLQITGATQPPMDNEVPFDTQQPLRKQLVDLGKKYKIKFKQSKPRFQKAIQLSAPFAFKLASGEYALLARISDEKALVQYSGAPTPQVLTLEELEAVWGREVIQITGPSLQFDVTWFIPEFVRYRRLIAEVLVFSVMLQILALVTPLFFQVVMDKVLVHNALTTLDVLVTVLVIVGIFEVILKGLREYLFAHTSNRIDVRLGIKLFRHLLGLPLLYFKHRHVGAIVTRVQELECIRNFLTGSMITLGIDAMFTFIFLGVMAWLSPLLTLVVLVSLPCYFILAWLTTAPLQKRIEQQFEAAAKNTSFLNESVSGAETLKSLAVEPQMSRRWEQQTQEMVATGFQTQTLNGFINHSVTLFQKVTSVVIIWVGAYLVMSLDITIGQLIAFNMMASHVSQPLAKLVELWQQFIQTRVAVDKLGDMLNLPIEQAQGQYCSDKPLRGEIVVRNLSFQYQPDRPMVLNNINLTIRSGESIGIVGPSGSGKSTLTRLLLKLYPPTEGLMHLDGIPLETFDPEFLRSQIGVVLQENYLFNRKIRENIALKEPTASLDAVVAAAKLAGAHDFILKLPLGYDTVLDEGGSSLSGGQRQRIAIARALMANPRILILDEATSALDDQTQSLIQANMDQIALNRTVIIIAHRLSTVRECDRILTLEQGRIIESGNHDSLLQQKGLYARLWQLQQELLQEPPQLKDLKEESVR
ncbi:peptidase C39 [Endozoicomonas sp. (ex Bugula neritina AB1)]|nr:peptidase C39 [Endozoicomonas sp. (ex Bugula neritina AB1)]